MTNLAPNSNPDSAFVPSSSTPFLAADPLAPSHNIAGALGNPPQMMPVTPELSGLDGQWFDPPSMLPVSQSSGPSSDQSSGQSQAVLQALANELAPIYPQVAKALIDPSLDSALQSGVGLFSRGSQLLESTVASGKGLASDRASDVGGSVREWVDGALARWQAANNPVRHGLNQQTQALVSDLKSIAAEVDDSAWMTKAKRRIELARQHVENAADSAFNTLGYVGNTPMSKEDAVVAQAKARLTETLIDLRSRADFAQTFETAFGQEAVGADWTTAEAQAVVDEVIEAVAGPEIQVVEASALSGEGAYGDNTIFVSDAVVADAAEMPATIDAVLIEEVGHYFDHVLNVEDSAGDEGDIFAQLVLGNAMSEDDLQALKREDDTGTLMLNGQAIRVENKGMGSALRSPLVSTDSTPVLGSDRGMHLRANTVSSFDRAFAAKNAEPPKITTPVDGSDRKLYLKSPDVTAVKQFDQAFAQKPQPPLPQPSTPTTHDDAAITTGAPVVQVQAGDTLWEIAQQNGVSWTDLRKPDGTAFTEADARSLQIGAEIVLPSNPVGPELTEPTEVTTVSEKVEQLTNDSVSLSTASPYAAEAMAQEAADLVAEENQRIVEAEERAIAEEKRQKIERLKKNSEILSTASPYASEAMNAELEALIEQETAPDIEQLRRDSEILSTASPSASQVMNQQAEQLIAEEERKTIDALQEAAEALSTASPYASEAMQAEVDDWFAQKSQEDIRALNQVDGQGLEHRFMGQYPEAAELLGTGNYEDNLLSGFDVDLEAAEQAANDYNGGDSSIALQSIFDPAVADKPTTIDEYSVRVDLPEGVSPEDILLNLATDMDGFLGGEFADLGDFKNQGETPAVGQAIDIDVKDGVRIFGWKPWFTESPFNAPVMITEIEDNNFTVQTIKYNGVEHLLHGTREWGYEQMPDGTVNFYTRGISVEDIQAAEGILWIDGAKEGEYRFWNAQIDGIENYVVEQGGRIVEGSRVSNQTEGPSGNDIWETLTAEQQEMTRQRQIEELERELAVYREENSNVRGHAARRVSQHIRAIESEIAAWENRS